MRNYMKIDHIANFYKHNEDTVCMYMRVMIPYELVEVWPGVMVSRMQLCTGDNVIDIGSFIFEYTKVSCNAIYTEEIYLKLSLNY